jgi:hypothetical protein
VHEIGRIDGGKVFQNGRNVFQIGGNNFYDRKNELLIKIPGGGKVRNLNKCRIQKNFD